MDSRSRVEAALALETPDRPPIGVWGHAFNEEWSAADLAAVTVENARRFGWDFVKFQPRASCFAEALGSRYRPRPGEHAELLETPVRTSADWASVPQLDAGAPPLADQVDAISRVASGLGPSIPVLQTVFSPLTVAGYLVGKDKERMVSELRAKPGLVVSALHRIASGLIDFATQSVAAGAAGIFYAVSGYTSSDVLDRTTYEELVLPIDLVVAEAFPSGAWFNVLHTCGGHLNFELASAFPVHAVSWSLHDRGNPSLAEGRDLLGKAAMGGLDQHQTLLSAAPESVREEVRTVIATTGGRGVLIAPGCSAPPATPAQNLASVAEALA